MAHALNLVLHLKQDPEAQQKLAQVAASFADKIQPRIDEALGKSQIVHFARVLVIDNKYLLVITEYDGDHKKYTDFFRVELPDVFEVLFSLAEGAPSWDQLNNQNTFFEAAKSMNVRSLGMTTIPDDKGVDGKPAGYLFSAYSNRTVKEILGALQEAG